MTKRTYAIYRLPGEKAKRSAGRFFTARPRRMGDVTAENEAGALEHFIEHQYRGGQHPQFVSVGYSRDGIFGITAMVTLKNGRQAAHVVTYYASRHGR